MTASRKVAAPPRWQRDAAMRRLMLEQIRQRRQRRQREISELEAAIARGARMEPPAERYD